MKSIRATTLLTAAIAASLPSATLALNVQPDGIGQVLLYPYYTVENGQSTLLSVVNNSEKVKAVRVRFRESANGRPVLDFNLYLSPFDTWTAAVHSVSGATGAAVLSTADRSCTVPAMSPGAVFSNYAYSGTNRDHPLTQTGSLSAVSRTREGFIELIEMGALQVGTGPTQIAEELTQTANGIPINCNAAVNAWLPPNGGWATNAAANIDAPTGGLYGYGAIVDVAGGAMMSYDATALARFYVNAAAPGALHRTPGASEPNLASADNGNGSVVVELPADDLYEATTETLPAGTAYPDAVSLALLRYGILSEFNTESGISAATEWAISFPTKWFYTDVATVAEVRQPFTDPFRDDGYSCDGVKRRYFSREAQVGQEDEGEVIPCTPPPGYEPYSLNICQSATVLTFNQIAVFNGTAPSTVLGATDGANIETIAASGEVFSTGHARVCFDDPLTQEVDNAMAVAARAREYQGLPVLGFSVTRAENSNAQPGILASYAGATKLRTFVRRSETP